MHAQQLTQPDVVEGHERERREKVSAELAVGDPRPAFRIPLERERIYQHGLGTEKLHIIGRRVLERHSFVQGCLLHGQGEQGSVLELTKAPLIRVRHKRDALRFENTECTGGAGSDGNFLVRHQHPALHEMIVRAGRKEQLIVLPVHPD